MVRLSRIVIFPIKSLDGVEVSRARVTAAGALAGDREFALTDEAGRFVNGKRAPAIHRLGSRFDLAARTVSLWPRGEGGSAAGEAARSPDRPQASESTASATAQTFHLDRDRVALDAWFSDYFGQPVTLKQNPDLGFPDDTAAWGPTVVAAATLDAVAGWFPGLSAADLRRRLRTNLELDGAPAFWEDRLYGPPGRSRPFRIGPVPFAGVNPCQRCPVPARDPDRGTPYPDFQSIFVARRRETLPDWAARDWFDRPYRLTVNTQIPAIAPEAPARWLARGDVVAIG